MSWLLDYPLVVLVGSLAAQWLAAFGGRYLFPRKRPTSEPEREQVVLILNAALTLLALLIGFSFAMATSRYDQRKNYEEAEANAIGTEYLRADLLPPAAAARVHALLISYTQARIQHYEERDERRLAQIEAETAQLQSALWSTVAAAAAAQPTATMLTVVTGMNDVLNSQGYTQAAWWNRIPAAAWALMFAVALPCAALLGRVESRVAMSTLLLLPLILSIALFLISDIDSPRKGVIRVVPQNLVALARSLPPRPSAPLPAR